MNISTVKMITNQFFKPKIRMAQIHMLWKKSTKITMELDLGLEYNLQRLLFPN
jgi:hypothetical protein